MILSFRTMMIIMMIIIMIMILSQVQTNSSGAIRIHICSKYEYFMNICWLIWTLLSFPRGVITNLNSSTCFFYLQDRHVLPQKRGCMIHEALILPAFCGWQNGGTFSMSPEISSCQQNLYWQNYEVKWYPSTLKQSWSSDCLISTTGTVSKHRC